MASFSDNIQALTTFTPYVEQQPIETMRAVGMQKQQQYDEGYQRIQNSIDKVAGLDIMKDADKQYLQTKLNQLGNKLQTVAAADFSNFQLANSTAGMAYKIGNDSRVQNAVGSTNRVRKEQSTAQAAEAAGKSSIQNQYDLNMQIQSYLNDGQTGSVFNGKYSQYIDIDAKLRDVAEKVKEIDNSIDHPFKRDAQGNNILGKDGKPIVDDAIMRIKTTGKSVEKILNNFYSSLNENDINQLHIDSKYHYRGTTPEMLKADAVQSAAKKQKYLEESVANGNILLDTDKTLSLAQRGELQAKITALAKTSTDGTVQKELQTLISRIDKNPDEVKYGIYTDKALTGLAEDLSYQSYTLEYENNPYAQQLMAGKELQFKYDEARRNQANFYTRLKFDDAHFQQTFAQNERSIAAKKAAKEGPAPIVQADRISTDVEKPTLQDLDSELNSMVASINKKNSEYMKNFGDPSLKTPAQRQKYLNEINFQYKKDPSMITRLSDNNLRAYLEDYRANSIQLGQKLALYTATVNASKVVDTQIDNIFKQEPGLPARKGGRPITAKQAYEFSDVVEDLGTRNLRGGRPFVINEKALMSKYKGTAYERLAIAAINKSNLQKISAEDEADLSRISNIRSKFNGGVKDLHKKKLQVQTDYLAAKMPEFQAQRGSISKDNKVDMDIVDRVITDKTAEFNSGGLDNTSAKDFDPDLVAKMRISKNVGYSLQKKYDGSGSLQIVYGGKTQSVPLTAGELASYFPKYARRNSISDIKYAVLSSPNLTTNLTGGNGGPKAINSLFSGYDLKNLAETPLAPLVRLDVEGKIGNNGSSSDMFQVIMYVNDNGQWIPAVLNNKGFLPENQLQGFLEDIGPNTVQSVLNTNKK